MTITPMSGLGPQPTAGPAISGAPAGAGSADGGLFLWLVQGLLDGSAQQTPTDDTDQEAAETAPETEAGTSCLPVLPFAVPVLARVATPPDVVAPAVTTDTGTALPSAIAGPITTAAPAAPSAPAETGPHPGRHPAPQPLGTADGRSQQAGGANSPQHLPQDTSVGGEPHVRRTASRPDPAGSAPVALDSTPTVAAGGVATPIAPGTVEAPVSPASPTSTQRVTQQVFPEVIRVVTAPEGAQRVTVRLSPESLGDVRVVLTNRPGGLEVSLSGGPEARRALIEGAPELHRLLDAVGRTDSRIVVRDLAGVPISQIQPAPAPPTPQSPGASTDLSSGSGGWSGAGAGRAGGEAGPDQRPNHHRGPGGGIAVDGGTVETSPSRRNETVTRARTGLDVTM